MRLDRRASLWCNLSPPSFVACCNKCSRLTFVWSGAHGVPSAECGRPDSHRLCGSRLYAQSWWLHLPQVKPLKQLPLMSTSPLDGEQIAAQKSHQQRAEGMKMLAPTVDAASDAACCKMETLWIRLPCFVPCRTGLAISLMSPGCAIPLRYLI